MLATAWRTASGLALRAALMTFPAATRCRTFSSRAVSAVNVSTGSATGSRLTVSPAR
jgi:hypothetical protein